MPPTHFPSEAIIIMMPLMTRRLKSLHKIYVLSAKYVILRGLKNKEAVAQMCSVEKVFLEISQNSQENTCTRASFLVMLQACNFIKKSLWHRCFPLNFVKFLRTSFFTEHLWWLLLKTAKKGVGLFKFHKRKNFFSLIKNLCYLG